MYYNYELHSNLLHMGILHIVYSRGYITIFDSVGFLVLYVIYILVVVVGRIINQRIRKKKQNFDDQVAILDDSSCVVEDDDTMVQNDTLAARENTRNSPTPLLEKEETISVIKINPDSMEVEESQGTTTIQNNFPEEVQEYEQILSSLQSGAAAQGSVDDVHEDANSASSQNLTSDSSNYSDTSYIWAWKQLAQRLNPIREFKELSLIWKVWAILKSPVLFLFTITVPVVNEEEENFGWCQYLLVLQCVIGCQFVSFFTNLSSITVLKSEEGILIYFWEVILILSLVLAILILCTSIPSKNPGYFRWAFSLVGFAVSIVWMYVIPNEIVGLLKAFGVTLNLSDAVLGLTVLAWGNSIGDFISDTAIARQGYPRMGFSACFGGPLLNLLLGIGIPFTIEFFKQGMDQHIKVEFNAMVLTLAISLGISLVSSFVLMPLTKFKATKIHGIGLIILYVALLTATLVVEFTVIEK